jgi:hypothetical protein
VVAVQHVQLYGISRAALSMVHEFLLEMIAIQIILKR